jgi:hypothetical protein
MCPQPAGSNGDSMYARLLQVPAFLLMLLFPADLVVVMWLKP